jgi:myo-inositol 2-dehydrogenase / D-chiro-inositol 1-dehydrogenase
MTDEHPEARVGILGAGFGARGHVEKLTTLAGVRITSIAEPQRERAESLAERCGALAVDGVKQVLAAGVEFLYVCLPPSEHGPPEDLAIAAGVPVFVEKPLAADLLAAEEIGERLERAGLLAVAGYEWRYLDTLGTYRRLLAEAPDRLVLGARLDRAPGTPWWADQQRSGGQVLEQATHLEGAGSSSRPCAGGRRTCGRRMRRPCAPTGSLGRSHWPRARSPRCV